MVPRQLDSLRATGHFQPCRTPSVGSIFRLRSGLPLMLKALFRFSPASGVNKTPSPETQPAPCHVALQGCAPVQAMPAAPAAPSVSPGQPSLQPPLQRPVPLLPPAWSRGDAPVCQRALIGRDNLRYSAEYCLTDDEDVIRIFRATWRALPLAERRLLMAHWQGHGGLHTARIETSVDQFKRGYSDPWSARHCLTYWDRAVNTMPDEILSIAFAGDLALTAYLVREHKRRPKLYVPGTLHYREDYEVADDVRSHLEASAARAARDLQAAWGFAPQQLHAWEQANRERLQDEWEDDIATYFTTCLAQHIARRAERRSG